MSRRCRQRLAIGLLSILCVLPAGRWCATATAQTPALPPSCCNLSQPQLRVFLDCNECDTDYLKTSVPFVEFVRDRAVADLHILVTVQQTGGGGQFWTLSLLGLARFQGHDHKLTFSTPSTATDDDRRKEFARVFKLGLVVYAADTSAGPRLDVTWVEELNVPKGTRVPPKDRWNFWVFNIGANGNVNGEESNGSHNFNANASANRTTDRWKINVAANTNTNGNRFTLDDGTRIASATHSWSVNGLIVKSLSPRWSAGATLSASHSSFSNQDRAYRVAPGVEFDVFPYAVSTRKLLTLLYTVGANHYEYAQPTIFNKLVETVPEQNANMSLSLRQPWGFLNGSLTATEQLNKPGRYRLSMSASTEIRLFKGFSFNVYGRYDRIRNLISLPQAPESTADVLLRLQQQATGYSYEMGFGIGYSFGSIFNSIVNPRFGGA